MRIALAVLALGSAHTARDCSLFATVPPPPAAAVTASLALPPPAHGGTVVAAEDAPVEVVVQADGAVQAYPVVVADATAVPPDATVYVDVHTATGQPRTVEMHWVPAVARFEGRLVGVAPAPGPLNVRVDIHGRMRRSPPAEIVVVHPAPPVHEVHVHGDVPRPRANVHADVHVVAPPPPNVRVEIDVPPPPSLSVRVGGGAYVDHHSHGKHRKHRGVARGHVIGRGHGGRGHGHGHGHGH
jgi:hypothetical protein